MQPEFWHKKWQRNEIGFHRSDIHPYLVKYWPSLKAKGSVFVPLCGKSKDMTWLKSQNHKIIGIELSEIAVLDFFAERGVKPIADPKGALTCLEADKYQIYVGDFFQIETQHIAQCHTIYDRAALIALPPDMQKKYVAHLKSLFSNGTQILLITLSYTDENVSGPPFSTPPDRVRKLYGNWCDIKHVMTSTTEDFRGTSAQEHVFQLTVKNL